MAFQTHQLVLLAQCVLFRVLFCGPTYVYDGVSTVALDGQDNDGSINYNWTLKYPLGQLCEDPNWITTIRISIFLSSKQGDLVLAFGSNKLYFGLVIPYDGNVWVPLEERKINRTNTKYKGGLWVAPPPKHNLYTATTTLEEQYTIDSDFRKSLIPTADTYEWHKLLPSYGPMAYNATQLTLLILGDRLSNMTQLTIIKNGVNVTTQMSSTWDYRTQVFVFMGMDAFGSQKETFVISGIERVDECTWQTAARTLAPTLKTLTPSQTPTKYPTYVPTVTPTKSTSNPSATTINPTLEPTEFPSVQPSVTPTKMPSFLPTIMPSLSPSNGASETPIHAPSVMPSYTPTIGPIRTMIVTNLEVEDTSIVDVESDSEDEDEDIVDGKVGNVFELIKTGDVIKGNGLMYVIAGSLTVVFIIVLVVICVYKCKKTYLQVDEYDNW